MKKASTKSPLSTMTVKLMDVLVLLHSIHRAQEMSGLSNADADRTLAELHEALNRSVRIDKKVLESALWSANMLSENKRFWHPLGTGFKSFIKRMFRGERGGYIFNTKYNLIMKEQEKEENGKSN